MKPEERKFLVHIHYRGYGSDIVYYSGIEVTAISAVQAVGRAKWTLSTKLNTKVRYYDKIETEEV